MSPGSGQQQRFHQRRIENKGGQMSQSVLYMSMSLDGYIAGPNDGPDNPGGGGLRRLHEWGFNPGEESLRSSGRTNDGRITGDRRGSGGSADRRACRLL